MLREKGIAPESLTVLQRLSILGNSGKGALDIDLYGYWKLRLKEERPWMSLLQQHRKYWMEMNLRLWTFYTNKAGLPEEPGRK